MQEQGSLACDAFFSTEAAHTPIRADDPVAGNHHRHGVAAQCLSDGARASGTFHPSGYLTVCRHVAGPHQRCFLEHQALERSHQGPINRQVDSGKIAVQICLKAIQSRSKGSWISTYFTTSQALDIAEEVVFRITHCDRNDAIWTQGNKDFPKPFGPWE